MSGSIYDPALGGIASGPPFRESDLSRVSVVLTSRERHTKSITTKIDSEGKFGFEPVAPGYYRLQASLEGHASFVIEEIPVVTGQETMIGSFPLEHCPFLGLCGARNRFREIRICE